MSRHGSDADEGLYRGMGDGKATCSLTVAFTPVKRWKTYAKCRGKGLFWRVWPGGPILRSIATAVSNGQSPYLLPMLLLVALGP